MPRIMMASHKGGVGKTSSIFNIASVLSRTGRVLCIDMDPQCNLSDAFGVTVRPGEGSVGDLLVNAGLRVPVEDVIRPNVMPRIHLIPGQVFESENAGVRMVVEEDGEYYLQEALEGLDSLYDWVLIDTPPSLGKMTQASIIAADGVVGVLETDAPALKGVAQTIGYVELQRKRGRSHARMLGVFINQYKPETILAKEIEPLLQSLNTRVFNTRMPVRIKIAESLGYKQPVDRIFPNIDAVAHYEDLAAEIVQALREDNDIREAM